MGEPYLPLSLDKLDWQAQNRVVNEVKNQAGFFPRIRTGEIIKIISLVSSVFIVVSCSSTSTHFTAYKDNTIFQGHGGAVRSINGIELWTDGSPDRKFRIIGVIAIEQGNGQGLSGMLNQWTQFQQFAQASPESHLASEAKAHGGDAVIIIQHNQTHGSFADPGSLAEMDSGADEGGDSNEGGSTKQGHSTEAYIIKYVDEGN
jgi:hypothetical protein